MNNLFLLRAAIEAFPFIYIHLLPFKGKTRLPFKLCVLICTLMMTLMSLTLMVWHDRGVISHNMLLPFRAIQLLLLLLISVLLIKKEEFFKVLFTFFAVFPYLSAVSAVSRYIAQGFGTDYISQYTAVIAVQSIVTAITYFPVLIMWKKIVVKPLGSEKEDFWKVAFIFPFTVSLVNLLAMENGGLAVEMSGFKLLERLALFISVVACSYFTVHIRHQVAKQTALEEQARRDRLLLDVQQHQFQSLAEYLEATRAARHDFKHQIIALKTMCEEGDIEKISSYIDEISSHSTKERGVSISPNRTVNAIFDFYLNKAKEAGITVKMDMRIGESYGLSDSDLCSLLGNVLENAIEGCLTVPRPERFIRICSSEHAGRLYLTFDNSFDGKYKTDSKGLVLSRKRDYARTGVGVQSIRAVAEKYGGTMNVEAKDNVFCLSLSLAKKA